MPELIGFSTCTDFEPLYNMICYAMVVSAPEPAFYLNPAQHAVREREMGKEVLVKATGKTTFWTVSIIPKYNSGTHYTKNLEKGLI